MLASWTRTCVDTMVAFVSMYFTITSIVEHFLHSFLCSVSISYNSALPLLYIQDIVYHTFSNCSYSFLFFPSQYGTLVHNRLCLHCQSPRLKRKTSSYLYIHICGNSRSVIDLPSALSTSFTIISPIYIHYRTPVESVTQIILCPRCTPKYVKLLLVQSKLKSCLRNIT